MKVLVVEDEQTLNKNICDALLTEGFLVECVFDGAIAERYLKKDEFACVIMDVNLPGRNGYDLCVDFRKYNNHTPVLMLTAFDELEDKIKGFDSGTDDYLTKPFFMKELMMRVQSLIKRSQSPSTINHQHFIKAADIIIDTSHKKVTKNGQEIQLTPREYQILVMLCKNSGEIIAKSQLIKEIWGTSLDVNTNTIEVYVNFLRNKIDKPFGVQTIKTKVGYGYYFDAETKS